MLNASIVVKDDQRYFFESFRDFFFRDTVTQKPSKLWEPSTLNFFEGYGVVNISSIYP